MNSMKYSTQIQIRSAYETGPDGNLHHANVIRLVMQAGYLVTDALGMTTDFFAANGTTIILRGVHVEFENTTRDNEILTLTTWLTHARRFRGFRELQMTSAEDGRCIANARLDWVYLNLTTQAPTRFPPEMLARVGDETEGACRHEWMVIDLTGERHIATRAAQHHEIDLNQHVNTAVYVEWLEQAWCEATGRTPAALSGHHIEFLRSAVVGDVVRIETQQCGPNLWQQEVKHADTNDVLVTNVCAGSS
jgi:acyl-CoA thioesterase FadM